MKKINDLKSKINSLELEKEKTDNEIVLELIDSKMKALHKELNQLLEKFKKNNKREINSKLGALKLKMNNFRENGDLKGYLETEKELRELKRISRLETNEIKYLTVPQINKIIEVIEEKSQAPTRDSLLIMLGFELGFRAREILELKFSDLYLDTAEILCRRKKNSIHNRLKITKQTLNLLKKYLLEREKEKTFKSDFIFQNSKGKTLTYNGLNYIIKRFFSLAYIPVDLQHYHVLKHSRGVWLAEQDYSIQAIKNILGHKSIRNTLIYASHTPCKNENIIDEIARFNIWG